MNFSFLLAYSLSCITVLFSSDHRCMNVYSDERTRPNLSLSYATENFQIHYDVEGTNAPSLIDSDGGGIPDYVEEVAEIAEASRNKLVDVMGYLEEPDDGDGLYDIYIVNQSAWGWNVVEDSNIGSSYVKIDNDYAGNNFQSDYCADDLDKMRISVAHEYFHAIQRAYRPNPTTDHDFLLEMSSMWFEDLMVPNCNDYLSFVDALSYSIFNNPTQKFDGEDLTPSQSQANFGYSMALFGHYLTNVVDGGEDPFQSTIMREIWSSYSSGISARDAVVQVVENEFEDSFSRIWTDFISRNMFCGYFNYFNQDFYFYSDQQYIDPISISSSDYVFSNESESYNIALNSYSANILGLGIMEDLASEMSISNFDDFKGYLSVIGPSSKVHSIVSADGNQLNLKSGDKYYFILSSVSEEIDVNILFNSEDLPLSQIFIESLYPNPTVNNEIYINIQNNFEINNFRAEFYDILGNFICDYSSNLVIPQGGAEISIPVLDNFKSSGVYFMVLFDGGNKIDSRKITIAK